MRGIWCDQVEGLSLGLGLATSSPLPSRTRRRWRSYLGLEGELPPEPIPIMSDPKRPHDIDGNALHGHPRQAARPPRQLSPKHIRSSRIFFSPTAPLMSQAARLCQEKSTHPVWRGMRHLWASESQHRARSIPAGVGHRCYFHNAWREWERSETGHGADGAGRMETISIAAGVGSQADNEPLQRADRAGRTRSTCRSIDPNMSPFAFTCSLW